MENKLIYCACGCGKKRWKYDKKGRERKYINFHGCIGKNHSEETKQKLRKAHLGIKNPKVAETLRRLYSEGKLEKFPKGIPTKNPEISKKISETAWQLNSEGNYTREVQALKLQFQCRFFLHLTRTRSTMLSLFMMKKPTNGTSNLKSQEVRAKADENYCSTIHRTSLPSRTSKKPDFISI